MHSTTTVLKSVPDPRHDMQNTPSYYGSEDRSGPLARGANHGGTNRVGVGPRRLRRRGEGGACRPRS